jgi:hypothetical protein
MTKAKMNSGKLKEDKKLTAEQERWLSFAEEADAAVRRGAREF